MAADSESTPFLTDHESRESHSESDPTFTKASPANYLFKRAIRILTAVISFLSLSNLGLLIASWVLLNVGPFEYGWVWSYKAAIRDLSICLLVNFLLTTPTLFFQIPSLINMAVQTAMSITILVFSAEVFGNGLPASNICLRWDPKTGTPLPETRGCLKAKDDLRTMIGISSGVGIVIGLLILTTLLLRLVALFKAKPWEGHQIGVFQGSGWKPHGFTVQFNLTVLPNERAAPTVQPTAANEPASVTEEGLLIEA